MELFRDDKIEVQKLQTSDPDHLSVSVRVDFSEVELYRRQLQELAESNQRLELCLRRQEEAKKQEQPTTAAHHQHEYEEILVCEVEVQTDSTFAELEARLRKAEADRSELAKELSHVRKTLFDTQKKTVREKELSQQTYSALVEKYETDSSRLLKEIEHLNAVVKDRAREAEAMRRDRMEANRALDSMRRRESEQGAIIDTLSRKEVQLQGLIEEITHRSPPKPRRTLTEEEEKPTLPTQAS